MFASTSINWMEKAMARGRQSGKKNRTYPALALSSAIRVAAVIQDDASGMKVSRLTLSELLDTTPTSSVFRDLVSASRFYGLTEGGINADEFNLTPLGIQATGGDEVARDKALKSAVMSVTPYKAFLDAFGGKKVPGDGPLKEYLIRDAGVDTTQVDEVISYLKDDLKTAGLVKEIKGSDWIDLAGVPSVPTSNQEREPEDGLLEEATDQANESHVEEGAGSVGVGSKQGDSKPRKVFIAHGKNRTPLEQLKKALDQFKVKYAVAVDEANRGRPISKKVAELMQNECSSGIFIFTADERFTREVEGATEEVWRPSENVVFELGAASILYDNRIVIFKEKGVSFPSDFSDLGYIEFEKDQLVAELGNLFQELVALDILEVRAKG